MRIFIYTAFIIPLFFLLISCRERTPEYDVVIYGGTSSGIAAAVQTVRMNKSVIVIEPGTKQQLGGLTSGGLGRTDFGNKKVIGGISLEFYKEINKYYRNDSNWTWQNRDDYFKSQTYHPGATNINEEGMWFFEPSAARTVFQNWVKKYNIPVVYGERIVREGEGRSQADTNGWMVAPPGNVSGGVTKNGSRIIEIVMESGMRIKGRYFIDTSYEGDLLSSAGISFTVGREGYVIYGEQFNGVSTKLSISNNGEPAWHHHQFEPAIDPYISSGKPGSGLLPMIKSDGPGTEGQSDHKIQAYCFRMCLTDVPENRIPFEKPEGYNELDYELLFRNYEAGFFPFALDQLPHAKP